MDRRDFLLAGGATLISGTALAQRKMMDQMPGMGAMHGGHAMPPATGAGPALPEGAPLRNLPRLMNRATEPGLFEAEITAAPTTMRLAKGLDTPILAYNGESPGPLIEVTEGDRVRVTLNNRLPDQETTIHWHGMPVPADQDGNPMDPVAPGTSRTYEFTLPEGHAASYWYHPHPHGLTAEQVYRGLAGVFLVKPKIDPIPASYGDTVLFFTDVRLGPDGTMPPNTMRDVMNGRVGDHVLVNGQKRPVLSVPTGTRRRFRLFNATNARFLRISFADAPMTIIGSDGGLLEAPIPNVGDALLVPAERLEVVVGFDRASVFELRSLSYDRGWMGPGRPDDGDVTLMTVIVEAVSAEPAPALPFRLRPIEDLGSPAVRRRFDFGEAMTMGGPGAMGMEFLINGRTFDMARVDVVSKVGEVELWEIRNPTDMDHPFHVHGTQFQVLEVERAGRATKPAYRAWKDTVNVARAETVRIAVRQPMPGRRMYHCHILEHEQHGMMGVVDVIA